MSAGKLDEAIQFLIARLSVEGVCVCDQAENILYVNDRMAYLLGIADQSIVGQHLGNYLAEFPTSSLWNMLSIAGARDGMRRGEIHLKKADGTLCQVSVIATQTSLEDSPSQRIIYFVNDVTEHKQMETQLKLLETAVRDMKEAVIITDSMEGPEGYRIIFVNEAATKLTGYTREELIGQSSMILLGPRSDRRIVQRLHQGMSRGEPTSAETINYRKDETEYICNWSVSPIHDETGQVTKWVSVRRDVTDLRKAEDEQLHTRKLRAVGELAGGIAHEFKNLLTPMLMQIQTVADDLQDRPDLLNELGVVRDAITKAKDLSERILMLGKNSPTQNEWHHLSTLVDENLRLISKTIDRRVEVGSRLSPNLPVIWVCKYAFSQVMLNLVFNSRDTLLEKLESGAPYGWIPKITITLESVQAAPPASLGLGTEIIPCQRFAIEDNGKGIPLEIRDRLFEPFFTTKPVNKGTGLGLSLVWNLVNSMGGWITVQSVPGIGTRMLVFFPESTTPVTLAKEEKPTFEQVSYMGKGVRVLLVEDDQMVRRSFILHLNKLGLEVLSAKDGVEAISLLEKNASEWHLVITDLNMPQMDGADLSLHLRTKGFKGKIIVITGFITSEDRERLKQADVSEILSKPVSREEITESIQRVLSGNVA